MDIALHYFDEYIGDALYSSVAKPFSFSLDVATNSIYASNVLPSSITDHLSRLSFPSTLPRDNVVRQSISIYLITYLGAVTLYFTFSTFSYYFIFDHRMKEHPRFLPSQVRQEILCSLAGFPLMDLLMVPFFLGDVRGYSKLYDTMAEGPWGSEGGWKPWAYVVVCTIVFLVFTDFCIYWIHRWLHIPVLYKRFHKPHHKWIVPTPFAAYAFHPVDGFLQGVPYHLACYIFPMHKLHWVGMFVLVNLWTVFIHDSDMISNTGLEHYINDGQYFVMQDKIGGSFRAPAAEDDPLTVILEAREKKKEEGVAKGGEQKLEDE